MSSGSTGLVTTNPPSSAVVRVRRSLPSDTVYDLATRLIVTAYWHHDRSVPTELTDEKAAPAWADAECLSDAAAREAARERVAARRMAFDAAYVEAFSRRIGEC